MATITRVEIAIRPHLADPRGETVAAQVRSFLGIPVKQVRTREVYRIEADLTDAEQERILNELVDPVLHVGALGRLEGEPCEMVVSVGYKPGVTDPVAKSARVAVQDTLGRELEPGAAVYTSRMYRLWGVDEQQARRIADELLANPIIQSGDVQSFEAWSASPPDLSVPKVATHDRPAVQTMDLSGADAELERISREGLLALNLAEMHAIRDYMIASADDPQRRSRGLSGRPTDVELECLAQTWSEHCSHKIFNATIEYREPGQPSQRIASLFKTFIRGATETIDRLQREARGTAGERADSFLVSVFHDNAGAVRFDDEMHIVYKVETHNSPSALDPYGGAMTGIVGVNRDPFGTGLGCDLLVNVWGYCFAQPDYAGQLPRGLMHPRRIRDGVHQGVIDGGNQSGVPYGRGWELFDARFLGKPLVFCGTVGSMPVTIAGQPGEQKAARPGDRIVMTGGRIGADGIHGATFSSAALDESAPVQAVQIGDPITQKRMFDFLLEARARGLYSSITDNGAGGLSSSVGEMAESCGGARLDLALAPLKYSGLAPWEILVSEAQERMTLAVPPEHVDEFLALAASREVEATVLGEFTDDGVFHVMFGEETVAHLSMDFLHDGAPDLQLKAAWAPPRFEEPSDAADVVAATDLNEVVLDLLASWNIRSNETKARHYDHEVKGLSVIKPWIGVGRDIPAEATVFLARHGSYRGFVLSEGINPFFSDIDTEAMAEAAVDEAVRRQLCAGATLERIALLDNFCWPDPVTSETTPDGAYKLAQLVRACRGLHRAAIDYCTPLISGKDSMKNDSTMGGVKISVPPTLLVSAMGQIDDVRQATTLELRQPGDVVFLVGATHDETGGSEYFRYLGRRAGRSAEPGQPTPFVGNKVPRLDTQATLPRYRALAQEQSAGHVRAAATPGRGGWALAWARCCMAGGLGMNIDLDSLPEASSLASDVLLFSETNGRFIVTTTPEHASAFQQRFPAGDCVRVGTVNDNPQLLVRHNGKPVLDLDLERMKRAFKTEQA